MSQCEYKYRVGARKGERCNGTTTDNRWCKFHPTGITLAYYQKTNGDITDINVPPAYETAKGSNDLRDITNQLIKVIDDVRVQNISMNDEIRIKTDNNFILDEDINNLKSENDRLKSIIGKLSTDLDDVKQKNILISDEVRVQKITYDNKVNEYNTLCDVRNSLITEIGRLKTQINEKITENNNVRAESIIAVQAAEKERDNARILASTAKADLDVKVGAVRYLEQELDQARRAKTIERAIEYIFPLVSSVSITNRDFLHISSFEIYDNEMRNVANTGVVSQTNTYENDNNKWGARCAINDNPQTFNHTLQGGTWKIVFNNPIQVKGIVIRNRADGACSNRLATAIMTINGPGNSVIKNFNLSAAMVQSYNV